MLSEFFILSKNLSPFRLDDILFNPNLFISSIFLQSCNAILFSKVLFYKIFCSISLSISSKVSPINFIACSKTLLWIKAVCPPIFDFVEYDSLLYFSTVSVISFRTLESFFQKSCKLCHSVIFKKIR